MIVNVICQICGEYIGKADTETLAYPLNGSMFKSPDHEHGIPDPFHTSLEWEDFRCPYGRIHRPSTADTEIVTNIGTLVISKTGGEIIVKQTIPAGRDSIIDRSESVPEEQAEEIIREEMGLTQEANDGKTEEGTGEQTNTEPLKIKEETKKEAMFVCNICGKQFKNKSGLINHRRMVHKG